LLSVAEGKSYTAAAKAAGRRSGDAVSKLVSSRFNREGLAALEPGHGGGRRTIYTAPERERILAEVRRKPDREEDATASWSLSTLRRALRKAPDGLPTVSTYTI
jgi:transposase